MGLGIGGNGSMEFTNKKLPRKKVHLKSRSRPSQKMSVDTPMDTQVFNVNVSNLLSTTKFEFNKQKEIF